MFLSAICFAVVFSRESAALKELRLLEGQIQEHSREYDVLNGQYSAKETECNARLSELKNKLDLEHKKAENLRQRINLLEIIPKAEARLDFDLEGVSPLIPSGIEVQVTSYNPEVNQTDSTPCIAGGTGYDLCGMANVGERPIALSQELIEWGNVPGKSKPFGKGDNLCMTSLDFPTDPRCNGRFIVSDAMNIRWRKKADIFFMSRKDNISCKAIIRKC